MPNVKRKEVDERRLYMKSLILKHPTMSGYSLNELFYRKYQSKMRINTIFDLKEELGLDRRTGTPTGKGPTTFQRQHPSQAFPMLIQLEKENPTELVQKVLDRLSAASVLINLRVITTGANYIVLEQAT